MGAPRERLREDRERALTCRRWWVAIALCAPLALPAAAAAQQADVVAAQKAHDTSDPPAFTTEQLEQMLAPIALYPDDLLSQILMAATYPLEIVQADRWVKANADLKDEESAQDLEQQDWDPSVKSLVAVPDVLALLSDKLDWTQQIGDAFIAQSKLVLDTVQALRARAQAAGTLASSDEQTVDVQQDGSTQTIVIESAQPDVIYVPVYDYGTVYGYWPYPAYPPYAYYPPHYRVGAAIAVGFAWGYAWGHCDWHGSNVDIDINRNTQINRNIDRSRYARGEGGLEGGGAWRHDPVHRDKLPYRDAGTAKRFDGVSSAQATAAREPFRGRGDSAPARVIRGGEEGGRTGTRPDLGVAATAGDRGAPAGKAAGSGWLDAQRSPAAQAGKSGGALDDVNRGGREVRRESQRGQTSRARSPSRVSGGSRGGRSGGRGGGRGGR
jgi:hypothetical protein